MREITRGHGAREKKGTQCVAVVRSLVTTVLPHNTTETHYVPAAFVAA